MSAEPVARPHPEPVVLDIGGTQGALIVYWDAAHLDTPVEISIAGQDADRQHQHILERPLGDARVYAAVHDKVAEGRYTLWVDDQPRAHDVEILGGHVTELDWTTPERGDEASKR